MGGLVSHVMSQISALFGTKEMRILILGLDNAGKTTLLYRLHLNDVIETSPTLGFNMEVVQYKNIKFQVWDLGGQDSIRPYWRCYYNQTDAMIFVVDSQDEERMAVAKAELDMLLQEPDLKDSLLLVFANKQDMPHAMNVADISRALDLTNIKTHPWTVISTSAKLGTGVAQGMEWLHSKLEEK